MSVSFQKYFLIAASALLLASCASKTKIVYLQDIDKNSSYEGMRNYEAVLQPDDLLGIVVSSVTPEAAMPFNVPDMPYGMNIGSENISGGMQSQQNRGLKTYLIDNSGQIDFPILGKVKLGGLSKTEANALMVEKISKYIKDPTVSIRILNYKVSVMGEVQRPGPIQLNGERISLLDALASAGDLTIYGQRKNILVIRDSEGKKTFNRVDITKSDFLNSPFYYLAQNDVVYVEPNQTRTNSSVIGSDISAFVSITSLVVSLTVLLLRI